MPNTLPTDLGVACRWSRDSEVSEGFLTLRELDELIRRAGIAADLIPRSEFPVCVDGRKKRIDWAWVKSRDDERVVAAFELDGLGIDGPNAEKALLTLETLAPPLKYLLLFQIDHNFTWKGSKGRVSGGVSIEIESRRTRFEEKGIVIKKDDELCKGYIHEIISAARKASLAMS